LSFLYDRVFETYPNTVSAPPSRAFEEAVSPGSSARNIPLAFCMAASCDNLEPLQMMLDASDGQMYVLRAYDPDSRCSANFHRPFAAEAALRDEF